ncbi:hypothetical protein [Streptomyces sp. Tu6071]|uniref:hypothetical protein n=1 Tax=Streptomyces sp. Tu6071 TaxID=355249 RepID=UPI0002FBAAC1|nr:hypothetical protein [Streptomyces sp. Tu6071]
MPSLHTLALAFGLWGLTACVVGLLLATAIRHHQHPRTSPATHPHTLQPERDDTLNDPPATAA